MMGLKQLLLLAAVFTSGLLTSWALLGREETRGEDCGDRGRVVEDQTGREEKMDTGSDTRQASSEDPVDASTVVATARIPNTPPVYVELLPPSRRGVSLEDLHWTFARETRHESWAFQVETEIRRHIENKNVSNRLVLEHIECREKTCEVAGHLLNDEAFPTQELLADFDRTIWWHERYSMHSVSGHAGGMRRVLLIITAQDFSDRIRPPRPLN